VLEIALIAAAFGIALLLTAWVRKFALSMNVVDVPNARSSHIVPTPRGGGVATVVAASAVMAIATLLRLMPLDGFVALAVGGFAIAAVGFLDDRRALPPKIRLFVHIAAALWALLWLGGLPPLRIGDQVFEFGWGGYVLGVLGIVWTLNLFNFMDGIDGIAASQAVFIPVAAVLIGYCSGAGDNLPVAALIFAAACAGFLVWNWPPAKIFMGDVGSGYMGYGIAVLALLAARENPVALLVWVILGGLFFVDATVTLVRRVARRERASEAHRSHAYQQLSRRWGSHLRVTLLFLAIDVLWLLPCALVAASYPDHAGSMVVAALAPILVGVLAAGAGARELHSTGRARD
jgi:Fuc2NAc and GlcNAc transferase